MSSQDSPVEDSADLSTKCVPITPRDPYGEAIVEIVYRPAGTHEVKRHQIRVGDFHRETLAPLPRGRELPWEIEQQAQALKMVRMRQRLADDVARLLAERLLQMFAAGDPINGFSPEEWEAIKQQR